MTPPAWRNGLSAKSQKNKRKISLQKERAEGRDRSINKGWKDWPSECGIQEGVYFQNKSLQIRCFLTDEENGLSKSLCLGLETCPQWPKPLSQQGQLLFPWLWWQPLSKQGSSAGYPYAPGSCVWLATLPILLGHLESWLPALPTCWDSPRKPHQPFLGSQPGMIGELSLTKFAFGWLLAGGGGGGALLFFTKISSKKALRQGSQIFFRSYVSGH